MAQPGFCSKAGCYGAESAGNAAPHRDLPLLLRLVHSGRIALEPLISERIRLQDVNKAIARQRAGEVARSLVVLD